MGLRHRLRELLESGRQPDEAAVVELNSRLSRPGLKWGLQRRAEGLELKLQWREEGWGALIATVIRSYVQLLAGGGVRRVRICANPDCSYMFHDDTRNGSRRWCDAAICGNLLTVRRHRARTRRPTPGAPAGSGAGRPR